MCLFLTIQILIICNKVIFFGPEYSYCQIYICTYVPTYIYIVKYTILLIEYATLLINNPMGIGV